jgi:hypothetical protein
MQIIVTIMSEDFLPLVFSFEPPSLPLRPFSHL